MLLPVRYGTVLDQRGLSFVGLLFTEAWEDPKSPCSPPSVHPAGSPVAPVLSNSVRLEPYSPSLQERKCPRAPGTSQKLLPLY